MTNAHGVTKIGVLEDSLRRARMWVADLCETLGADQVDAGVARHQSIGLSGAAGDVIRLPQYLPDQGDDGLIDVLSTDLHEVYAMARALYHQCEGAAPHRWELALGHARRLTDRLDIILVVVARRRGKQQPHVQHAGTRSRRLVAWAVRLLPPAHRVRYREEFLSELYDLRYLPGWQQLRYGLRLLVRAFMLRRALRAAEPAVERTR